MPLCVIMLLIGATNVMGAKIYEFKINLSTSASIYSDLVEKETTSTTAYVARTGLAGTTTSLRVRVVNNAYRKKSSEKKVTGIATVYPSYSGYNVQKGDFVMLLTYNNPADNQGQSVGGKMAWYP